VAALTQTQSLIKFSRKIFARCNHPAHLFTPEGNAVIAREVYQWFLRA